MIFYQCEALSSSLIIESIPAFCYHSALKVTNQLRMNIFGKEKTGLALGGGAALGAAHVGVLKALEESDNTIDCISGTSVGAMIASFYAFGLDIATIEEIVIEMDWLDVSGLSLSKMGLLSNAKLGELIKNHLGDAMIEDADIELAIIATDLSSGEKVVFREGNLAMAVMASTCVPGVYIPVEQNGRMLVDGGLVENVPAACLREMGATRIIGVDINALRLYEKPNDIVEVILNALDIGMENISSSSHAEVDLMIRPDLSSFSRTVDEPEKLREMIQIGYEAASKALNK